MHFFNIENRWNTIKGIAFVSLFAIASTFIAQIPAVKETGFSAIIIGVVISMIYGNTVRNYMPSSMNIGILYTSKFILRTAIVFYGFRITFQQIEAVGIAGFFQSLLMLSSTFLLGIFIGTKILKMDRDLTLLTSAGSAVCGAAAVLATESVLKSESYKSVIAVTTVVLFGTISMFVYPLFYSISLLDFTKESYSIYIGGSIHEVAQVVVAGNAVSDTVAETGLIVKMTRVMLLAPLLLVLGLFIYSSAKKEKTEIKTKQPLLPYFIFTFIGVAILNSVVSIPKDALDFINTGDTFLLTMAMSALGMETQFSKFKQAGAKPIILASLLFIWLIVAGYFLVMALN